MITELKGGSAMVKRTAVVGMITLFLASILTGCSTSAAIIIKPVNKDAVKINTVQVDQIKTDVKMPPEILERIGQVLIRKLENSGKFNSVSKKEGALVLRITVTSFDAGDQVARWLLGGAGETGKGEIMLETVYVDARSGYKVGQIRTHGSIVAGFFGGSIEAAYASAVDEIVKFTIENFGN